jgi:flagellar hook protein FlgE
MYRKTWPWPGRNCRTGRILPSRSRRRFGQAPVFAEFLGWHEVCDGGCGHAAGASGPTPPAAAVGLEASMGIFDALTTAVTGLQAQSFALQNISGNIANSQTVGFKETDTSFQDLVTAAAQNDQTAGSVLASSAATNNVQGAIQSESVSTDMAINGDGYFIVAQPTSVSGNQPVFNGVNLYTRRGDFQENQNGFLVNGAGYYLMGIPIDQTTGNPVGSVPQVLQFGNNEVPAQATTQIQYQANLPTFPQTTNANTSVPGSELINPLDFTSNPLLLPATIRGAGATLQPDAAAVDTGTTDIAGLPTGGNTGSLVLNGTTISIANTDSATTILQKINAQTSTTGVSAALNASNDLVLTSANATTNISTAGSSAAILTELGVGAGANATNLLTQGAVTSGQTLTMTVGVSNPTLTITFGTNPGDVQTLAQLNTALASLAGGTASVNTANGDLTVAANNLTDQVTIGGSANAAKFGVSTLTASPPTVGPVIGNDVSNFLNESISGGSITTYDSLGNPVNVQLRWAKVASAADGGTDTWELFYQTDPNATGTQAAWVNAGTRFQFNSSGQMNPPVANLTLNNLTVNGDTIGNVQLSFGSSGVTQFADASGAVNINQLQQNGSAAGKLTGISVDNQNRVIGTFSNGQTQPLAQVTLATFNGQNYLQSLNGGAFAATVDSGPAIFSASGKVVGSSLEGSNVDIATQFSQLIVAQQAYSANAKVMTTADQMIQSLLTVIQ